MIERFRGMTCQTARPTVAELRLRAAARLALERVEIDRKRPRPVGRVDSCRRRAGRYPRRTHRSAGGPRVVPSGLCTVRALTASSMAGIGTRSKTRWSAAPSAGGRSPFQQSRHQGHEFRRPRELAIDRLPAAGQDHQPSFAFSFLNDGRVTVFKPAQGPWHSPEQLRRDEPMFPEMDLREVVELGPASGAKSGWSNSISPSITSCRR